MLKTEILQSRPHFVVLDGLRGTAAIAIVVFHFMEMIFTDYSLNFIGHGFLAVDFFFCLSGFVIGYAYDGRIREIGVWEFFKSRLIRLHPLVVFGSVLGLVTFLFNPFTHVPLAYSASKIVLVFVSSLVLIPYPVIEERGFALFALNSPSWSLFFEYIANIVYAFFLFKTGKKTLVVLTFLAAVFLLYIGSQSGTLIGGWDGKSIIDGWARIGYSFLAGLLVYRLGWIFKTKMGFVGLSVLILASFMLPYVKLNWLLECLVVIFFYPLIITLGAGASLSKGLEKLCVFFGKISYPLYMSHIPFIWWFGDYMKTNKPSVPELFLVISVTTLLLIGFAYLVMIVIDLPLRRFLNKKSGGKRTV